MITIQYGPWTPDLANIPFQLADQEGPVEVPVADCLNVYYVNGAYRSIPSPAVAVATPLSLQCVSAYTFKDVNGQPVPVAAQSNGTVLAYYQGSWITLASVGLTSVSAWNIVQFGSQIFMQPVPTTAIQLSGISGLYENVPGGTANAIASAPYGTVMAVVGQFIMVGDVFGNTSGGVIGVGDGVTQTFTGTLANVPSFPTSIKVSDATSGINGIDNGSGVISGTGIAGGIINYDTGAVSITFSVAPAAGHNITAVSAPGYRARLQWSPIGNPGTTWPTPLTNAAIAAQSGINDLEYDYGPIMGISGYPLYGVIFQRNAITRAQYIGGNVVWSWQTYARNQGLLVKGALVQVGLDTYFLSDSGFFSTDGANVVPIGTTEDNSAGIDQWFFANVNTLALSAIRCGYDARMRSVCFAIPTGVNTLPDTVLMYNVIARRWTRSAIAVETVWTDTDGSTDRLGLFNQSHQYRLLTGAPSTTGYLESCDLQFSDGLLRDTNGVRPIGAMTAPIVTVGTRNTLEQAVTYNAGYAPDSFSAGFAPALTEGLYTRIRVSDTNATSIHSATCDMVPGGQL